jgi:hypothetical protein
MPGVLQPKTRADRDVFKDELLAEKHDIRIDFERAPTMIPPHHWKPRDGATDSRTYVHHASPDHGSSLGVAKRLANKLAFLFWPHDTQAEHKNTSLLLPRGPCAAVWHEWLRCHKPDLPDLQVYFAMSLKLGSDAPTRIPELLELHKKLCDIADETFSRSGWTGSTILPICRAVMIVLDQEVPKNHRDEISQRTGERITRPVCLEAFAPLQNLLLVRTGKEEALSAPIDFTSLAEHALPLARDDIPFGPSVDGLPAEAMALRVPLPVAVTFLHNLQRHEETTRPDLYAHLFEARVATFTGEDLEDFENYDPVWSYTNVPDGQQYGGPRLRRTVYRSRT